MNIPKEKYEEIIKTLLGTYCCYCTEERKKNGCHECRKLMTGATDEEVKEIFNEE